jgi:L,D-peptidoglycan transpeptidase YkuD (ErfK/YbiS/YcfS/YnhG family)
MVSLAAAAFVLAFTGGASPAAHPCVRYPTAGSGEQLITVEAASHATTYATVGMWRRTGECWDVVGGPFAARVGRSGLSAHRHEGDGTTPIGSFRIGATMYGNAPDPGVHFRYHRLVCGDWWSEDSSSPTYNSFQHAPCGTRPPFRTFTGGMWQQPRAYSHLAVVEYNMRPVRPGRGSGIFLHAQTGRATNGCISLERKTLVRVLRWLRPAAAPRIVIGTGAELRNG